MEVIIAAAILAGAWLWEKNRQPKPTAVLTPPLPGAVGTNVIQSGAPLSLSGAYNVAAPNLDNFGTVLTGRALTGRTLPSTPKPIALPSPPPWVIGGIAGTVGTGGNPLGGRLRPGITLGTATTVVGPSRLASPQAFRLAATKPVIS